MSKSTADSNTDANIADTSVSANIPDINIPGNDIVSDDNWYKEIYDSRDTIITEYFHRLRKTEEYRTIELSAVLRLQSYYRMHRCQTLFQLQKQSCTKIQRIYRGYQTRTKVFIQLQHQHQMQIQKRNYDSMAILIQKIYRGYLSRKYFMDFYARKRYISDLTKNADIFMKHLRMENQREIEDIKSREEVKKSLEFNELTTNLHHLLSTKCVPGIFRSPFGEQFSATANGITMEKHIRQSFHHSHEEKYYKANMIQKRIKT